MRQAKDTEAGVEKVVEGNPGHVNVTRLVMQFDNAMPSPVHNRFPDQNHRWVHSVLGPLALPDAFRGHEREPEKDLPHLRWSFARREIRLEALTDHGLALLDAHAMPIYRTIHKACQPYLTLFERHTSTGVEAAPGVNSAAYYRISRMVANDRSVRTADFHNDQEAVRSALTRIITRDCYRQASVLGVRMPRIAVENLTWSTLGFAPVMAKRAAKAPVVTNVRFMLSVGLRGPWAVGGMTNKGFGRIVNDHSARESDHV